MKKRRIVLLVLVVLASLHFMLSKDGVRQNQSDEVLLNAPEYSPNEVIVKFRNDTRDESIILTIETLQGKIVTYLGRELTARQRVRDNIYDRSFTGDGSLFLIKVPEQIGTDQAISLLRSNPEIEYAERNYALVDVSIDDLYYHQWALNNSGQSGGTPDADIDAPEAWALSTGSADIVVAVIDGGIDYLHPDLAENLWINAGEWGADGLGGEKYDNNIDDDHNGYVDDWRGWHFNQQVPLNKKNDPMPDNFDHATIIAGIIGAAWNDIGIRGINQNVKIMNLNAEAIIPPVTWASDFINGVDYAITNGASVISCSVAYTPSSPYLYGYSVALEQAIIRARNKGILFVSGCGNIDIGGPNLDASPLYPGCYPEDNIINVLGTNRNDLLADGSCWGDSSVDIGAPGEDIISTVRTEWRPDPEDWYSGGHVGTSFAAPHVAGVAALALGKCPALTYSALKARILDNSDFLLPLFFKCRTGARVNAHKVLYDPSNPSTPNTPTNLGATPTAWYTIELYWQDNSNNEVGFEIQRCNDDKPVFLRHAR
jgi:subtilisin family serine protease